MSTIFLLLFLFLGIKGEMINNTNCDGFQGNFDIKSVIGTWHVVTLFPGKYSMENLDNITCYKVEFSEIDEAGLRWLVNNTLQGVTATNTVSQIKGTIVRQRYFSERPFDVWSKAVEGANGCFQQVLALDMDKSEFSQGVINDAMMQLHLIETTETSGPILVQLLWGKMISVVLYRRDMSISPQQLIPVLKFLGQVRGPLKLPIMCF